MNKLKHIIYVCLLISISVSELLSMPTNRFRYVDNSSAIILRSYKIKTVGDLLEIYISEGPDKFYDYICDLLEGHRHSLNINILKELKSVDTYVRDKYQEHKGQ